MVSLGGFEYVYSFISDFLPCCPNSHSVFTYRNPIPGLSKPPTYLKANYQSNSESDLDEPSNGLFMSQLAAGRVICDASHTYFHET